MNSMGPSTMTRRRLLWGMGELGALAAVQRFAPAYAWADARHAAVSAGPPDSFGASSSASEGGIALEIDDLRFTINGRTGNAMALNGTVPGPLLRLREGSKAVIRVTNRLEEVASIHWHGLILPPDMDGVPGVSFAGIRPGETFTYRFLVRQSGTYWFHSHSGGQEQLGVYAPLLIDPAEPDPVAYDRDYVVMLSDWSFVPPKTLLGKLKKQAGYFNLQRRTVGELLSDIRKYGSQAVLEERAMWAKMRMDPTDFADVTGVVYTYLLNGLSPEANWTGLFTPGEKVRLRFIDAAAMTIFDIRIPGLKLRVVQADGQNIQPVEVDEFRMGPAETYDVIVTPDDRAYTLFAENLGRSGYTRGTLAPRPGMSAPVPEMRPRPIRTMADMGMEMAGMDHGAGHGSGTRATDDPIETLKQRSRREGMEVSGEHGMTGPTTQVGGMAVPGVRLLAPDGSPLMPSERNGNDPHGKTAPHDTGATHDTHGSPNEGRSSAETEHGGTSRQGAGQEHAGHEMGANPAGALDTRVYMHGPNSHGVGNSGTPMSVRNRMGEPGIGLEDTGTRVLVYTDLKSLTPREDPRPPSREIELHITGNMDRYMWGFNGKKYSQSGPVRFNYGERLRLILVNDTMMEHPIHLHGMWMEPENGAGRFRPRKHTVVVKPAERFPILITADAPGHWAMHCHLLLHMEMGMFRVVEVIEGGDPAVINADPGDRPTPVRESLEVNRRLSSGPPYREARAS
jgi:CopA family copper-resistance protein